MIEPYGCMEYLYLESSANFNTKLRGTIRDKKSSDTLRPGYFCSRDKIELVNRSANHKYALHDLFHRVQDHQRKLVTRSVSKVLRPLYSYNVDILF